MVKLKGSGEEFVLMDFLVEGLAVDAQDFSGLALIAPGLVQD